MFYDNTIYGSRNFLLIYNKSKFKSNKQERIKLKVPDCKIYNFLGETQALVY